MINRTLKLLFVTCAHRILENINEKHNVYYNRHSLKIPIVIILCVLVFQDFVLYCKIIFPVMLL